MNTPTHFEGTMLQRHGRPFVVVGAELHNSSSSSLVAIEREFRAVREIGANTVLAPVAWDLIEPQEGHFDFRLLDAMIVTAAAEGLALIPLWFGSWKNGKSTYVPSWVKHDVTRFPRAHISGGGAVEVITPFSSEARAADSAAFAKVLSRIGEIDSDGVVVMVQVENEVGLLGDSRDRSTLAQDAWSLPVPGVVIDAVRSAGTGRLHDAWRAAGSRAGGSWEAVLGAEADESFMAYAYADYVEAVAAAGRRELDVPLFANAWLDTPIELDLAEVPSWADMAGGQAPGAYPSGGPLSHVAPIWRAAAPSLELLAPDLYFGDFDELCRRYSAASQGRLMIPEMRRSPRGVGNMFLALAEHRAIGVAPFGVDSLNTGDADYATLADGYRLLRAFAMFRERHPEAPTRGFQFSAEQHHAVVDLGGVTLHLHTADPSGLFPPRYPAYCAVIQTRRDEVVLIGRGVAATFAGTEETRVGILSATELDGVDADEVRRRLGGDEIGSGEMVRLAALDASTPSAMAIPFDMRSTGIVQIQLYSYPAG